MADRVIVKQPNPQIAQPVAEQHNPIAMFEGDVVVMPYGYCTINKMTSGVIGKLKQDYLYPQYMFFDAGCGQTVLEFDQELPEDWEQVLDRISAEPFNDPELDAMLPPGVFEYSQSYPLNEQLITYIKCMQQYKASGVDDQYLNSLIVEQLEPYIDGDQSLDNIVVEDNNENTTSRVISRNVGGVVDGVVTPLRGGGELRSKQDSDGNDNASIGSSKSIVNSVLTWGGGKLLRIFRYTPYGR